MENQLVKICQEYDLDEQREGILVTRFSNVFQLADDWEVKIAELEGIESPTKTDIANANQAFKICKQTVIDIDKTRIELGLSPLREKQAIDKVAKILSQRFEPLRDRAKQVKDFEANKEASRLIELAESRKNKIYQFQLTEFIPVNLKFEELDEVVFNNIFEGAKLQKAAKELAIAEAEKLRIEKIEAERIEKERIEAENLELKKQAEIERLKQLDIEKYLHSLEEEKKAKAEAEAKIAAEKLAAEKKAKAAPDKEKLIAFSNTILSVNVPELSTDEGKKVVEQIKVLLNKISLFCIEKSNNL